MSPKLSRRRSLTGCVACLGLLSGLSGCSQVVPWWDEPLEEGDGVVVAKRVASVPADATVTDYDDVVILDHEEIQTPIRRAAESGSARYRVERPYARRVESLLSQLPKYAPEQDTGFEPGYYFAYEDRFVVLNLLRLQVSASLR